MKKYTKFNATFRLAANTVLVELGLVYAGNPRRVNNGTLFYWDPIGECYYALYESGYCRRFIPVNGPWGRSEMIYGAAYKGYQLNKTVKGRWVHRILAGPDEQLGRVTRAIVRYRGIC